MQWGKVRDVPVGEEAPERELQPGTAGAKGTPGPRGEGQGFGGGSDQSQQGLVG